MKSNLVLEAITHSFFESIDRLIDLDPDKTTTILGMIAASCVLLTELDLLTGKGVIIAKLIEALSLAGWAYLSNRNQEQFNIHVGYAFPPSEDEEYTDEIQLPHPNP